MFFEEPHEPWEYGAVFDIWDYIFLPCFWLIVGCQALSRVVKRIHEFEKSQCF